MIENLKFEIFTILSHRSNGMMVLFKWNQIFKRNYTKIWFDFSKWQANYIRWGVLETTLCDKVCQWLAAWCVVFSGYSGSLVSSTNRAEILLKVSLSAVTLTSPLLDCCIIQMIITKIYSFRSLVKKIKQRKVKKLWCIASFTLIKIFILSKLRLAEPWG